MLKAELTYILLFIALIGSGQENYDFKKLEKSLKLIPSQTIMCVWPDNYQPLKNARVWKRIGGTHTTENFHMADHEVTNAEYNTFLSWLERNDTVLLKKMKPYPRVSSKMLLIDIDQIQSYGTDLKYEDYAVGSISYYQALAYCEWLTSMYSEFDKAKFKNVRFTLPTEEQWLVASGFGSNINRSPYPFDLEWNTNGSVKTKPDKWPANFMIINQSDVKPADIIIMDPKFESRETTKYIYSLGYLGFNQNIDDFVKPVKSFKSNKYGIYDLAGGAQEMLVDKGYTKGGSWLEIAYYMEVLVDQYYTGPQPDIGFRIIMIQE